MSMINFDELDLILQALKHDVELIEGLTSNDKFLRALEALVLENFDRVFNTQGRNINEDWDGNSLVDTGRLKLSVTSSGEIGIQVIGNTVVFSSSVAYASYVNDKFRFVGVDDEFDSDLSDMVSRFLKTEGKLQWSN